MNMKKKIFSLVMAGLIGVTPLSSFAAGDNLFFQSEKPIVNVINQHKRKPDHNRREKDRREQEQRERERREHERREKERKERERRERERKEQERNDARYIIHRTANVIYVAQRSTGRRNYYNGLAQAIAHQQKARQLFMAGSYQSAIHHSLRARKIAISVIEGNKERWSNPWDAREEKYRHNSPRDRDLDIKLNLIKIGDKEAIKISIDLDL
jgi:hypothetical protein